MATKKAARSRKAPPVKEARPVDVQPPKAQGRCVVCGDEVAPFSVEELCWVCRRLKISAWREADVQASAPE